MKKNEKKMSTKKAIPIFQEIAFNQINQPSI